MIFRNCFRDNYYNGYQFLKSLSNLKMTQISCSSYKHSKFQPSPLCSTHPTLPPIHSLLPNHDDTHQIIDTHILYTKIETISPLAYSVTAAGLPAAGDERGGRRRLRRRPRARQEEAHEADLQRPADIRPREDVRADQVPSGSREGQARLRPRHVRVPSQGKYQRLSRSSYIGDSQ